jgi:hypothetical protein
VNISGAGSEVDGEYARTEERLNEREVFQKLGDEDVKLFYVGGAENRWLVGNSEAMNAWDEQGWDGRLAARIEVNVTLMHK